MFQSWEPDHIHHPQAGATWRRQPGGPQLSIVAEGGLENCPVETAISRGRGRFTGEKIKVY